MAPINASTEIGRPPDEVFAYVTDPTHFADWQQGVVSGSLDGDTPHRVGDKCLTTRRIGGGERTSTSVITHIDQPRTWGVRGIDGPIRATVGVTVTPINDGSASRVTIELDFAGHGIGKLLVPLLVRPGARKEMPENMKRLKERLEARAGSAGQ